MTGFLGMLLRLGRLGRLFRCDRDAGIDRLFRFVELMESADANSDTRPNQRIAFTVRTVMIMLPMLVKIVIVPNVVML